MPLIDPIDEINYGRRMDPHTAQAAPPARAFRKRLTRLAAARPGPQAGLFAPDSLVWQLTGDATLFLGSYRALLLQIAHPKVAQAVADFSDFRANPLARGIRTFEAVHAIVFGSRARAVETGVHVYAIHRKIHGTLRDPLPGYAPQERYAALDPRLLMWVQSTLIDSALHTRSLLLGPLSDADQAAFYEDSKVFAAFFGVPQRWIPSDYAAFRRWWQAELDSSRIVVSPTARRIADALFAAAGPPPLPGWQRLWVAGMLPAKLRDGFGLRWDAVQQQRWHRLKRLGTLARFVPAPVRKLPVYHQARRREGYPRAVLSASGLPCARTATTARFRPAALPSRR